MPDPRGRLRADRRAPTSTSATAPSASTRATATWHLREHAEGRVRHRRRRRSTAVDGVLRPARRRRPCRCRRAAEAELTKLLENTFRHVNIALVNELAMFADDLGIDVWEAIDAASTKPFGFMRSRPGPGVGGHCLPIDPSLPVVAGRARARPAVPVRRARQRRQRPHARLRRARGSIAGAERARHGAVNGSRILLLGLAYKRNTGDARESPAMRRRRPARRRSAPTSRPPTRTSSAHDARPASTRVEPRRRTRSSAADAVVLLTDHDAFDYELVAATPRYVLDTRHRLGGARETL